MNIVIHTVSDLAYLHITAFVAGVVLAFVYLIGNSIGGITTAFRVPRFSKFTEFKKRLKDFLPAKLHLFLNDLNTCILFCFALLSVTFVLNSGNFRLLSVATMLLGFYIGKTAAAFMIETLIIISAYIIKIVYDVLSLPFVWIFGKLCFVAQLIIKKFTDQYRRAVMDRYTKQCFKNISKQAELGFCDKYYKELSK